MSTLSRAQKSLIRAMIISGLLAFHFSVLADKDFDGASPLLLAAVSEGFNVAQTYQQTCFACHGTGAAHAPEVGDVIEWEIRLEKGFDTLLQNTINGLNGIMPPKGLCAACTDDDLKALVEYILDNSK